MFPSTFLASSNLVLHLSPSPSPEIRPLPPLSLQDALTVVHYHFLINLAWFIIFCVGMRSASQVGGGDVAIQLISQNPSAYLGVQPPHASNIVCVCVSVCCMFTSSSHCVSLCYCVTKITIRLRPSSFCVSFKAALHVRMCVSARHCESTSVWSRFMNVCEPVCVFVWLIIHRPCLWAFVYVCVCVCGSMPPLA